MTVYYKILKNCKIYVVDLNHKICKNCKILCGCFKS